MKELMKETEKSFEANQMMECLELFAEIKEQNQQNPNNVYSL